MASSCVIPAHAQPIGAVVGVVLTVYLSVLLMMIWTFKIKLSNNSRLTIDDNPHRFWCAMIALTAMVSIFLVLPVEMIILFGIIPAIYC